MQMHWLCNRSKLQNLPFIPVFQSFLLFFVHVIALSTAVGNANWWSYHQNQITILPTNTTITLYQQHLMQYNDSDIIFIAIGTSHVIHNSIVLFLLRHYFASIFTPPSWDSHRITHNMLQWMRVQSKYTNTIWLNSTSSNTIHKTIITATTIKK